MFFNFTFGQTIYIIDTRNDYQICLFFFFNIYFLNIYEHVSTIQLHLILIIYCLLFFHDILHLLNEKLKTFMN